MLLDNPGLLLIGVAIAGALFLIGLVIVAASVYFFVRKKDAKVAGIPTWTALLGAGLLMTLIVPGAILFLLLLIFMVELASMPPVVTCYAPVEDPVNVTTMAAGALIASRVDLLDRLHADGRIPDSLFKKLKK